MGKLEFVSDPIRFYEMLKDPKIEIQTLKKYGQTSKITNTSIMYIFDSI